MNFNQQRLHLVERSFASSLDEWDEIANPQLNRFFQVGQHFKLLDLKDRDWKLIEDQRFSEPKVLHALVSLSVKYMLANIGRIRTVASVADAASSAMLDGDNKFLVKRRDALDGIDRQSLFYLRLETGINIRDHRQVAKIISAPENAKWVRSRILYPFIYSVINVPNDSYIDTLLSFTIPQDGSHALEKDVMKFVLRDDISIDLDISLKLYIGLLCHPFDLHEFIINHLEMTIAQNVQISNAARMLLIAVRELNLDMRADALMKVVERSSVSYADGSSYEHRSLVSDRSLPEEFRELISEITSLRSDLVQHPGLDKTITGPLQRMRYQRYPVPEDFALISEIATTWRFLRSGKLIAATLMSMYMLPRKETVLEVRDALRLFTYLGCMSPYLVASPSGDKLTFMLMEAESGRRTTIFERTTESLSSVSDTPHRIWFHALHWTLTALRHDGRITQWLEVSRQNFPVKPNFLSGIKWDWIDQALETYRITPFRRSPDGPYVLLLQEIEERQRDTTVIRTAIELHTEGRTCPEFVDWLIEEYDSWSVAFVKFFLTPENIMLLNLAPNMMAALSERIIALETCVAIFKFTELLTEDQLRQERQTLTSALMLLNVNANQFEIPWATFRRDVADRQSDRFDAYRAIRSENTNTATYLGASSIYPHQFPNGRAIHYSMKNSESPIGVIVLGVVDSFLDHPSYGIEAILSTRFRHDTLRREFAFALGEVGDANIIGAFYSNAREIVDRLNSIYLNALDEWLTRRVQTVRPGFDKAIFDFCPNQSELDMILADLGNNSTLEDVTNRVANWLDNRLEDALVTARTLFLEEHVEDAISNVAAEADTIKAEEITDDQTVERIKAAVIDTIVRRANELVEWFKTPQAGMQKSLTFSEMKMAVDGRFERIVNEGRLSLRMQECEELHQSVPAEQVRFYFDILSEIVANAIKYGGLATVRIRIRKSSNGSHWGFIYSSLTSEGCKKIWHVDGHPYLSLSEELFREKNSGLHKIAALAASMCGASTRIFIDRRKRSFHLFVPLGKIEE